ncbi:MAG: hypothetical protein ACTS5A_01490 [Candidatus Hodgkinia cicadicola]
MKLGTFERKVLRLREWWTAEDVHSNGRRGFASLTTFDGRLRLERLLRNK